MRCHKVEEWILCALDGLLGESRTKVLEEHLRGCSDCRRKEEEYRVLQGLLKNDVETAPLPGFLERLEMRIRERAKPFGLMLWGKWSLRAIPLFLGVALAVGAALIVFAPPPRMRMTSSELLLLRDQYSMAEIQSVFEGGRIEDQHLRLIFAAADEGTAQGRKP